MRRGFTLIELMAAVAILAVVSIMAAQVLGGAMLQRELLVRRDQDGAALMRALTMLRRDFEAVAPLAPADDGASPVRAALRQTTDGRVQMVRAGIVSVEGRLTQGPGVVVWALRDGVLSRAEQRGPPGIGPPGVGPPEFVAVLRGVTGFVVTPAGLDADNSADASLPAPGYEITLQTGAWGPVRLMVAR